MIYLIDMIMEIYTPLKKIGNFSMKMKPYNYGMHIVEQ